MIKPTTKIKLSIVIDYTRKLNILDKEEAERWLRRCADELHEMGMLSPEGSRNIAIDNWDVSVEEVPHYVEPAVVPIEDNGELFAVIKQVNDLAADAQPGLMSWCAMFGERMQRIVQYWQTH